MSATTRPTKVIKLIRTGRGGPHQKQQKEFSYPGMFSSGAFQGLCKTRPAAVTAQLIPFCRRYHLFALAIIHGSLSITQVAEGTALFEVPRLSRQTFLYVCSCYMHVVCLHTDHKAGFCYETLPIIFAMQMKTQEQV